MLAKSALANYLGTLLKQILVKIAVTGRPGIGKTTLCLKVYEALKDRLKIKGFVTKEVRERGVRIGFKIIDLESGDEAWLAKVGYKGKFRVGKYGVIVESIDRFAERIKSYADADLVILDEIGPMELKSEKFVEAVKSLLNRENLLFTIHLKARHPLLDRIRSEFKVIELTEANRNKVAEEIVEMIVHDRG